MLSALSEEFMALQPSLGMQRQREVSSAPGDSGMDTWQREPHREPALPEGQINICVLEASISYTKTCNFNPFPFIFIRWNHLLKVLPKCPHETPPEILEQCDLLQFCSRDPVHETRAYLLTAGSQCNALPWLLSPFVLGCSLGRSFDFQWLVKRSWARTRKKAAL